jgi:transcription initiation factor TFIIB
MSFDGNICKYCGSNDLIKDEETGEIICAGCGLVVSQVTPIRRMNVEESPTGNNRSDPPSVRDKMNRLMMLDRRIKAEQEKPQVLRVAIIEIQRLVQSLHLSETVEKNAEKIYRNAQSDGLIAKGTITGFAAASVYAACRKLGLPWTLRQISEVSPEDVKSISRMYRILLSMLNLSVELDNPVKHLSRIAEALNLSHKSERLAEAMLKQIMEKGNHVGKSPKGLAGSALYIACKTYGEKCTQSSLSKVSGVSSLTIRKRVKDIKENVDVDELVTLISG